MAAAQLMKKYVGVAVWSLNRNTQRKELFYLVSNRSHGRPSLCRCILPAESFHNAAVLSVAYYYDVILHTGNRFGAGTDANVFMKIHGEKGSTEEVQLPSKKGDLERGMVNKYKISGPDLGNLKKIDIRHDNTGLGPAWFLEKVTVRDRSGSRYIFDHGEWLLRRSGEDKLQARLDLSEQNLDQLSAYKGKNMGYSKLTDEEHLEAVEETVHKNISGVLQGIIASSEERNDSDSSTDASMSYLDVGDSSNSSGGSEVGLTSLSDALMLPSARLLVEAYNLSNEKIQSTGPKGHILKGDVLKYISFNNITRPEIKQVKQIVQKPVKSKQPVKAEPLRPAPKATKSPEVTIPRKTIKSEKFEDNYFSGEEKTSANQYLTSKSSIPHVYSTYECSIDEVTKIQQSLSKQDISVPIDAFLIKASALALKAVPAMNVNYVNGEATALENVDIAITLVNDSGVSRPILKGVHNLRLQQVAEALKDINSPSQNGNLVSEQASFSISNLGSFGVSQFCEIITPPQVCIMAVGASQLAPSSENNLCKKLTVTLSCDGRLIDETTASKFMSSFKKFIENPQVYIG